MAFTASDILKIILAIILPPLGVFFERGCGADLLINILLTILGYIPGIIHGFRLSWVTSNWTSPTSTKKDPPLAAYGVAQAADLAKYIKSLPEEQRPSLLFSSPYYRCLQTSNPSSEILDLPIYVEHGLSEWYSPVIPGTGLHPRPHDATTLKQYFPSIDPSWESIYYPDRHGETVKGVHDRCAEFLDALVARIEQHPTLSKHKSILLVSHAATCAALVRHLVNDRELPIRVGTCTLSILERNNNSSDGPKWIPQGTLAGADFLPGGVERDWGFEDAIIKHGEVIGDPGVVQKEDPGFSGLVPDKAYFEPTSASDPPDRVVLYTPVGSLNSLFPLTNIIEHDISTRLHLLAKVSTSMPAAKKTTKRTRGKNATRANARSSKLKTRSSDYQYDDCPDQAGSEGEASVSSDINEGDLELFRAAFASVKSKNTKKKNDEFLKKNQALVDEARKQAEAMELAGLAHIEQLMRGFETISQPSTNDDISKFADLVGNRSVSMSIYLSPDVVILILQQASSRELFETSKLSLEELKADYDKAFQDAEDEGKLRCHFRASQS
ncbi:Phosphoglycerate mutase-like protein [Rhizoctonia solani]|uniref:Phosphoglycerate mutase-like protein n=1 Tax=Rhizoctonia solani TaxID=456999 RepID=A0A8H7HDI9_9AGAM|nr:Phosphoglycerate mutase-like protein [Rhizoctonia solani]